MTATPPLPSARERAVFCNRTLNLRAIGAIGYDMDYTLVHYRVAEWEAAAFEHARQLLARQGWPVDGLRFDPAAMIQGLIVDTELGNLLKVNRFGYTVRGVHGARPLEFDEQRRLYGHVAVDHRQPRFAILSTLFSLSLASLYAHAVGLFDQHRLPGVTSYADLLHRVRCAVDDVHHQGALKAEILAHTDRLIDPDPEISLALLDQRDAGKKLLLITNSEWSYTRQIMGQAFDRHLPAGTGWRDLFDVVIVSARKPEFFTSQSPLFEVVDEEQGLLRPASGALEQGRVYHGGNASLVENKLGLGGDQILFVGDHFFGDVHATKSGLRWRTALIVRELEQEIDAVAGFAPRQAELTALMARKESLEHRHCELRLALQRAQSGRAKRTRSDLDRARREIGALRMQIEALDDQIGPLAKAAGELSNPHWGLLMRAGTDKSYLAFLIERFADLYTARVSNFALATPFRYFRAARVPLPHDGAGDDGEPAS
ncbi:MAG: HAD-IG family 5'-nucleotidase [Deltaproteobacteria bacterium]|nr:HAD-IG family 5'-nucleotidase [Deltaproteobacteria bacterium]